MKVFVLREATSREQIGAICREHGLELSQDEPWTSGVVYASWSRGDTVVTLADDGRSGAQLLRVDEDVPELGEALGAALALDGVDEVLADARAADEPLKKIRTLYRAHALRLVEGEVDRQLVDLQCEKLSEEHPWVRWAAARLLAHRDERRVERALAEASRRYPDLVGAHERARAQCSAAEEGILDDAPTDDWNELLERARAGIRDGQPKRAARAMDKLLTDSPDHTEGLLLRARAYAALEQPTLALALLGAADACAKIEREVREGKPLRAIEKMLEEIRELRSELTERSDVADEDELTRWLERWAADARSTAACGAALAIIGRVPDLAAVLGFVAGRHRHDRRLLQRARERAPRSPWCLRALAQTQNTDRPEAAAALYEEALGLLDVDETNREEALIDRLGEMFEDAQLSGASSLEVALLEDLASLHYDERRWEDAIRVADRLVAVDPRSATAWQWRANARTFAMRHEEAVEAYREGLEALDRVFAGDGLTVGSDPRPGMRFNLACVLAKLERREEALDELRRAIRGEAKWASAAESDDYFETLWSDETFRLIVAGDAEALVLNEERQPEFVDRLVDRAVGLTYRGDFAAAVEVAERAVALADPTERAMRAHAVRAHSVLGRALALSGKGDLGVAKAVKARALAEHDAVDARAGAEVVHELGVTLHAAGNHERAADAYQHALTLRKQAYGEDHPIVAKSLGDIARLASDRGEPTLDTYRDGVELLERFLASERGDDDERAEALLDLAILQSNLAESLRASGDQQGALATIESCAASIEAAASQAIPMSQPFTDHALDVTQQLMRSGSEEQRARARAVLHRLEERMTFGSAEERRERLFWLRLRRFARQAIRGGVSEVTMARTLSEALRGGKKLAEEVRRIPEIASFAKELAERATRYPTLLAMSVIALSTAEASGNLDEALENLQELCVTALVEEVTTPPTSGRR